MEFIFFLGRFHVLVLHLPIGIILVTIALEFAARNEKYARFESAAPLLWATAAITAIVTVVFGYMHYAEGGYERSAGNLHRILGTALAVVTTIAWLLRARSQALYEKSRVALAIVLLVLVFTTGHYGGSLTHGSSYLFGAVGGGVTIDPDGNVYGGEPRPRRVQQYARVRP